MTAIYVLYLLLSALVVFLVFYSRLVVGVKAVALSVLVLLGVVTSGHYISQLGKPIGGFPSYEFVYVYHVTQGSSITLWAWSAEAGSKLYVFPYSQETAQELEEAKAKSEEGDTQTGQFTNSADDNSVHLETGDRAESSTERTK